MESQRFFADDTSIFIAGSSVNNVQSKVDETINKNFQWFERNRLIINKEKTIAISFHQPQNLHFECPPIKFDDTAIKYSEHSKFLGVWLDKEFKVVYTYPRTSKKVM
jgi:UDP-N-acetylglucosamine 2-epimerase